MELHLRLQDEDIKLIQEQVTKVINEQINSSNLRKHAYTVKEVAKQISYTANTVRIFIREGRKDRSGKIRHLPAKEITSGDYRILPHELDKWLSYF